MRTRPSFRWILRVNFLHLRAWVNVARRAAPAAIARSLVGGNSMWLLGRVKEEVRLWVVSLVCSNGLGFPNWEATVDQTISTARGPRKPLRNGKWNTLFEPGES